MKNIITTIILFGLMAVVIVNAVPTDVQTAGASKMMPQNGEDNDNELEKTMESEDIGSFETTTPEVDKLSNEFKQEQTDETSDNEMEIAITNDEQDGTPEDVPTEKDNDELVSASSIRHTLLPLYRYYRPGHLADHFYTTNIREIRVAVPGQLGRFGYRSEGIAGILTTRKVHRYSVPLYRYWNPRIRDHFYTTNFRELYRGRHGWRLEGIQGYCFSRRLSLTRPLYRYWNGNDHFYTVNAHEIGTTRPGQLGRYRYRSEGIACYIFY